MEQGTGNAGRGGGGGVVRAADHHLDVPPVVVEDNAQVSRDAAAAAAAVNVVPPVQSVAPPGPTAPPTTKRAFTRRSDRHLYTNTLPFIVPSSLKNNRHGSSPTEYLLTLLSSLRRTLTPQPPPPYEALLVGPYGCAWVQPPSRHRIAAWEAWSGRSTTVAKDQEGEGEQYLRGGDARVAVTHATAVGLWRGGFFGKAALSRGDPTWWRRIMENQDGGAAGESLAARRRVQKQSAASVKTTKVQTNLNDEAKDPTDDPSDPGDEEDDGPVWAALEVDPERYQITPEEVFFLAHAVGILEVKESSESPPLSHTSLWSHLRMSSTALALPLLPPPTVSSPTPDPHSPIDSRPTLATLHESFAVRYAAYHHYRSRGWVVKSGIKFGTDLVLYRRGPIFRHSDYAVVVVPSFYDDREDREGWSRAGWVWAMAVSRVCAQVGKRVLFCHVVVPSDITHADLDDPNCLQRFSVWDVCMGRWVPSRTRD
ncbi:tRNA splicing endonuclease subunit sen2 [Thoreauomyces humboldtii]|nr:tRNA splicing endonuclease subunit sen2 [Thoreauomyces humboldtii]